MSEVKTIYVTEGGFFFHEGENEPQKLGKVELLINGAVLKFEPFTYTLTKRRIKGKTSLEGFKVSVKYAIEPFGLIRKVSK